MNGSNTQNLNQEYYLLISNCFYETIRVKEGAV